MLPVGRGSTYPKGLVHCHLGVLLCTYRCQGGQDWRGWVLSIMGNGRHNACALSCLPSGPEMDEHIHCIVLVSLGCLRKLQFWTGIFPSVGEGH